MHTINQTKEVYRKIYTELITSIKEDPFFKGKVTKEQIEFIEMVELKELAPKTGRK